MRLSVIVALLCVAGWAGMAQAQAMDPQQKAAQDQQRAMQSSTDKGGATHQPLIMSQNEKLIEGQVIDYKTVDMANEKDHRVAQLKTREGQTIQVDLGTKNTLPSGFDIRKGQWVLVAGVQGQMGDQSVFVAHRWANVFNLSAGGGTPTGPTESLPGQERGSEGGSKSSDYKSDSDYKAHYGDYDRDRTQHGKDSSNDKSQD